MVPKRQLEERVSELETTLEEVRDALDEVLVDSEETESGEEEE